MADRSTTPEGHSVSPEGALLRTSPSQTPAARKVYMRTHPEQAEKARVRAEKRRELLKSDPDALAEECRKRRERHARKVAARPPKPPRVVRSIEEERAVRRVRALRWYRSAAGRDAYLRRIYGMRLAEYEKLLAVQDGRCAVCGCLPADARNHGRAVLAVDHDHATGRVRGLLCGSCNSALGNVSDSVEILGRLAEYLGARHD